MSVHDSLQMLDDSDLEAAPKTAKTTLEQVRELIVKQDLTAFAALMGKFAELVDDAGPLGFCRFEPIRFASLLHDNLQTIDTRDPEALCDVLHQRMLPELVSADWIQKFRRDLERYVKLMFIPTTDCAAACAAWLTTPVEPAGHGLRYDELPALYAIFRAQLVGLFLGGGATAEPLAEVGEALETVDAAQAEY